MSIPSNGSRRRATIWCIDTADNSLILRETMKDLEKRLDPRTFQRVHRSKIVNLDRVRQVKPHTNGECFLMLESGARGKGQPQLSRRRRAVRALMREPVDPVAEIAPQRMRAEDFHPAILEIFDGYVHGKISKREFLAQAGKFAVAGMTGADDPRPVAARLCAGAAGIAARSVDQD